MTFGTLCKHFCTFIVPREFVDICTVNSKRVWCIHYFWQQFRIVASDFQPYWYMVKVIYVMLCAIWYHLYYVKNVGKTHDGYSMSWYLFWLPSGDKTQYKFLVTPECLLSRKTWWTVGVGSFCPKLRYFTG